MLRRLHEMFDSSMPKEFEVKQAPAAAKGTRPPGPGMSAAERARALNAASVELSAGERTRAMEAALNQLHAEAETGNVTDYNDMPMVRSFPPPAGQRPYSMALPMRLYTVLVMVGEVLRLRQGGVARRHSRR
jgi:hypothetical protein